MNEESEQPHITFVAALPSPVNGMTVATSHMLESLEREGQVRVFDWSNGAKTADTLWRINKGVRSLFSVMWILFKPRPKQAVCYTVANSRGGLYYNILTVLAMRVRGYRCVLHHHVFAYVSDYDWRMSLLDKLLGPAGTHVVLCECMKAEFQKRYVSRSNIFVLPNRTTRPLDETQITRRNRPSNQFTLGHLSNLTMEKGLDTVIETFRRLLSAGLDVNLILAGPTATSVEQKLIDDVVLEHPSRVTYMGPVSGEAKIRFFRDTDLMVFPTRYRNEAQPLVILEAFSHGVPVVAFGRGCIPSLINLACGQIVHPDDSFADAVLDLLQRWCDDPDCFQQCANGTRERAWQLHSESNLALEQFLSEVICDVKVGESDY